QGIDPGLTNATAAPPRRAHLRCRRCGHPRFCNLADPRSIAFRAGEHLTVLERTNGDTWKGYRGQPGQRPEQLAHGDQLLIREERRRRDRLRSLRPRRREFFDGLRCRSGRRLAGTMCSRVLNSATNTHVGAAAPAGRERNLISMPPGSPTRAAQEAPAVRLARLGQAMQAGQAPGGLPDPIEDAVCLTADAPLTELCCRLGLPDTASACCGVPASSWLGTLGQMAWEDLEEIGHQQAGSPEEADASPSTGSDGQGTGRNLTSISQTNSRGRCADSRQRAPCPAAPAPAPTPLLCSPDPFLAAAESQQQPPSRRAAVLSLAQLQRQRRRPAVGEVARPANSSRCAEVPPQQPPPTPQRGARRRRHRSGRPGRQPTRTPPPSLIRPHSPAWVPPPRRCPSPTRTAAIRHKPASASIAAAFGRAALFQQHRQHQHQLHHQLQHLPASPAFARRERAQQPAGASGLCRCRRRCRSADAKPRWVLQPPPPRERPGPEPDDICGMLSELQCDLDRELQSLSTR
uniref:SH3 domain-containing protein n=1 Tax=Macrostomum lignano TaxID=282301 RepID=A0A1I8F4E1_9PLAT